MVARSIFNKGIYKVYFNIFAMYVMAIVAVSRGERNEAAQFSAVLFRDA